MPVPVAVAVGIVVVAAVRTVAAVAAVAGHHEIACFEACGCRARRFGANAGHPTSDGYFSSLQIGSRCSGLCSGC